MKLFFILHSVPMLSAALIIIVVILPQYVSSSCCRLPFTDGECKVNRKGPHRYQVMPDRRSGSVLESTECYINDFDANYRRVIESKNYCNDCPGLLIFHTNSSEIFLFPEYLERILEGRTQIQRKNVVILTSELVGGYDLDFTYLARYYGSHRVDNVPSIYVDLQMPEFNSKQEIQPTLRLRLPIYNEDQEGSSKISRSELINSVEDNEQNIHQLPYLYHFDIEKHRHLPTQCILHNVHVSSSSLVWETLDSGPVTCYNFMAFLGRNKCLTTGFTRLFCPIEESITKDDRLFLSPYLKTTNRVEHLTIAVVASARIDMSLNNDQMKPAERVKILLLKGHLTVTDMNPFLPIRVEYGSNCNDFSLVVPAGITATIYRRFDEADMTIYGKNSVIPLPPCFKILPNFAQVVLPIVPATFAPHSPPLPVEPESDEELLTISNTPELKVEIDLSSANITTVDGQQSSISTYWENLTRDNNLIYIGIVLLVLVALIPLCLGVFYRVYCNPNRKSNWKLDHSSHTNSAYENSKDDPANHSYVNNSTQTTDTPIRI